MFCVRVCIRTDLILTISAHWPLSGRQIFEDFRALRAQANFDSNFGKSVFTPMKFKLKIALRGARPARPRDPADARAVRYSRTVRGFI